MSIAADVGQLLWVGFDGTRVPAYLADDIAAARVGAVILFGRNLVRAPGDSDAVDIRSLVELNRQLRQCVRADGDPLWIALDQEGGRVQRVRAPAPSWPPMLALGRVDSGRADAMERVHARCERVGRAIGDELFAMGFDIDFAPVLDVHTNPANPIIGDRAFATDPDSAASAALAFARGLHAASILGCGKHFPGHGDTDTDSHLALPRLNHDMARLESIELVPFRRAIAAGIPMLMTAHIVFSALDDDVPATLSHRVMTELLRKRLGFRGIAVSDDMDMRAISAHYGIEDAAVRAIRSGCDALLLCKRRDHQRHAYEALVRAAEADSDMRERVGRAAERIRAAKRRHAATKPAHPLDDTRARALFASHHALASMNAMRR